MEFGLIWLRDIPNELLYLPICSFVLNNPGKKFHISCISENAKILMGHFIGRLDSRIQDCIHIIISDEQNGPTCECNQEGKNIYFFQPQTIFLNNIIINKGTQELQLFTINSDKILDESPQLIKIILYLLEENNYDIINWSTDIWDNFFKIYNSNSILNYFWTNYVSPYLVNNQRPCFSFCLYGTNSKYLNGFLQNISLIYKFFPDFGICLWIRKDSCVILSDIIINCKNHNLLDRVFFFEIQNCDHNYLTSYRIFSANHWYPTEIYSRDTDSRVGERDVICIKEFQKSSAIFHIIRDHFWHKSLIMAGTYGIKKINTQSSCVGLEIPIGLNLIKIFEEWYSNNSNLGYGSDEKFLTDKIYQIYKKNMIIHTNIVAYKDEITYPIHHELNTNGTDFVGNCYTSDNNPEFKYNDFPCEHHLKWLISESSDDGTVEKGGGRCFINLFQSLIQNNKELLKKREILCWLIKYYIRLDNLGYVRELFENFELILSIDENILRTLVVLYFKKYQELGCRIILTTDTNQIIGESEKETIIVLGDFPYGIWNLPRSTSNILYFPVLFYDLFQMPNIIWQYDKCWEPIKKIYVLNLKERLDRWASTLSELARMGAPLNRVHHYQGKKAETATKLDIYWEATKNHVDCVKDFIESGHEYCLILEDDIQFNSSIEQNKRQLVEFFSRSYDFDICMISYSNQGSIEIKDDLLLISRQSCTTSSGYILKKETAHKIYGVLKDGLDKMRETGDFVKYCCDRYWAKIQSDNKFFLLRNKIAYQRIIYSNITGCTNLYLD